MSLGWEPQLARHRHTAPTVLTQDGIATVHPAFAAAHVLAHGTLNQAITVADAVARAAQALELAEPGAGNDLLLPGLVREAIDALSYRSWRKRATLRLEAGSPLAESVAESASRAVIMGAGLEPPVLQYNLVDRDGFVGRLDCWWPRLGLAGEVDGMVKYAGKRAGARLDTQDAVRAEKRRENRLLATGAQLRRWGWDSITHPERLIRLLTDAGVRSSATDRLQ